MVVIIGGGPAGLTASYRLAKEGVKSTVLEQDSYVGGIARTVQYRGFRFDIGGHRFFTKLPQIQSLWDEILGEDFLVRGRLSRIFYRGKMFDYPLRPMNALTGLGAIESLRVLGSYIQAKVRPYPNEDTFEEWVSNRFGKRLFSIFFKTYTEKVWGMSCKEISSDWAAQRIKNLSLGKAVLNALRPQQRGEVITSLIDEFHYPRHGPGMMWEHCRDKVRGMGSTVLHDQRVTKLRHEGNRIVCAEATDSTGNVNEMTGNWFVSSMAIQDQILMMDPPPSDDVLAAAKALRYRDFLIVVLVVDRPEVFPDNWVYIHDPNVHVGRIQNFKNWSPEMVPDPAKHTSLGLEYFLNERDDMWRWSDDALLDLGRRECDQMKLIDGREVSDGCVVRMKKAYPVYDPGYAERVAFLRDYLERFENLQMVGRNGQHRYNNQDHSMMTALLAAENILGERHDIWSVNVEPKYHETLDRAVPMKVSG